MSQQSQWRGAFWRSPQGKHQLRGAAFMSDQPCWGGLCSDSAAFDSPMLLLVTPMASLIQQAEELSGRISVVCRQHPARGKVTFVHGQGTQQRRRFLQLQVEQATCEKARGNVGGCGRDLTVPIGGRLKRHKTQNALRASNLCLSIKETDKYGRSCAKIFLCITRESSNWK